MASAEVKGLPTILAVNRQLQAESPRILYVEIKIYIECQGPPIKENVAVTPMQWQPPQRLLKLSNFRRIEFGIELYPACPTRSRFEPLLHSAQEMGLRVIEHTWWVHTLAILLSPPHNIKALKSCMSKYILRGK